MFQNMLPDKKMGVMRRIACLLLAVALAASLLALAGCSTPEVAGTYSGESVDDGDLSTAEYLVYLYYVTGGLLYNMQMYEQYYSANPWAEMNMPYGDDEENQEQLPLEEYIVRTTQDTIVRQAVLKKMIKDQKLEIPADKLKLYTDSLLSVTSEVTERLGFYKSTYERIFEGLYSDSSNGLNLPLYEQVVFDSIYGKGGSKEMSETAIQEYYDKNILTYKIIEFSLADSSTGDDLSEEETKKIKDKMDRYLKLYQENGNDFDAVIKQSEDDTAAEASTTTTTTTTTASGQTTESGATTTTTTAATTTTTTATTTTTGATETTATGDGTDDEEEIDETDSNLKYLDASDPSDENLAKMIQEVKVGEAAIKEYKKSGTTKTIALVLRVDPTTTDEYSFEKMKDDILYSANQEEFNNMIKAETKKVAITIDPAVLKKCTPKRMRTDMEKKS